MVNKGIINNIINTINDRLLVNTSQDLADAYQYRTFLY